MPALDYAIKACDVIVIDEIAPMELFSIKFKEKVEEMLSNPKPVLSVLHHRYVQEYGGKGTVIKLRKENRDGLPSKITSMILKDG